MYRFTFFILLAPLLGQNLAKMKDKNPDETDKLLVLTVATNETDGYRRFIRSATQFDIKVDTLGLSDHWRGGDTRVTTGGAQKIKLLRERLEEVKDDQDLIVMFTDSYDVIFNADANEILSRFKRHYKDARVLFSAEGYCWPDRTLAVKYPLVTVGKRYLNSGALIGYAPELYKIVSHAPVKDDDDDQLYYTNLYLDEQLRTDLKMQLDSTSLIFQNLHGAELDIEMIFREKNRAEVHNFAYNTYPVVIHGNGLSKMQLNRFGNYIGNYWTETDGCVACREDRYPLDEIKTRDLPIVSLSIMIVNPTAFLPEFFDLITALDYPKHRMLLFVYNAQDYHSTLLNTFLQTYEGDYRASKILFSGHQADEANARQMAIEFALEKEAHFMFMVDSDVHLTNANALKLLLEQHRPILSPLVTRKGTMWTNFWGSLTPEGYYARSNDYQDIVVYDKIGLWNVPFIRYVFLMDRSRMETFRTAFTCNPDIDTDMSFCQFARDNGHFLYVDNQHHYGYLVNSDTFDTTKSFPEMYQLFENPEPWKARYLHPNYTHVLESEEPLGQPCPDVYDFPFFTKRFCHEMIKEMEVFGQWSSGKNEDERIQGGYENVPTRDIHMNQIGFERHWLYLLDTYVRPIQEKVYIGYYHKPIESTMMFVVRYKPDEQSFLRPHHDASTYSIDLAMNKYGEDFEGGGVRFVRYNCTVLDHEVGWSLIFPGRLTHLHEGLPVTKGIRYVGVSFINP